LRGCINDAKNVRRFLMKNNYSSNEIIILTDDERTDPRNLPTYENILEAMRWLVRGAKPHDSLFLHCMFLFFLLAQFLNFKNDHR
jgi:metacaspase-1